MDRPNLLVSTCFQIMFTKETRWPHFLVKLSKHPFFCMYFYYFQNWAVVSIVQSLYEVVSLDARLPSHVTFNYGGWVIKD